MLYHKKKKKIVWTDALAQKFATLLQCASDFIWLTFSLSLSLSLFFFFFLQVETRRLSIRIKAMKQKLRSKACSSTIFVAGKNNASTSLVRSDIGRSFKFRARSHFALVQAYSCIDIEEHKRVPRRRHRYIPHPNQETLPGRRKSKELTSIFQPRIPGNGREYRRL